MNIFLIFILILIIQRISELYLARKNEKFARVQGAIEYDEKGYNVIVFMHIAFFVSLVAEYVFLSRAINHLWLPLLIIFILAQFLRYWAISTLGHQWNTKILVIPNGSVVRTGPYKYLNHPNYLAVVIEIAVIPLLFSCYITAVIFSILNMILLRRRIRIENRALSHIP